MAKTEQEVLKIPLIQEYNKAEQLSVSNIYKLRSEELSLFFRKEHRQLPQNQGEKRESLVILEKVGLYQGLLKCLGTDGETGIIGDGRDIKRRQSFFGDNSKKSSKIRPFYKVFFEQFNDSVLKILLVAATLTLIIGLFSENDYQWIEGASIYFAVAFIALFASTSNYLKEKQFLKLDHEIKNEEVNVIRGQYGLSQPIKVFDVVVGDIILVETGMRIPADCILIDGMDVTVDEAPYFEDRETINQKSLSKEEYFREQDIQYTNNHTRNPDPFLLTDTLVMTGSGKAVVCAVGKHTLLYEMHGDSNLVGIGADDEANLTPLQQRLKRVADQLSKWGYTVGFLLFVSMCIFLMIKILFSEQTLLSNDTLVKILDFFTISVAIIVVAVPEGLPLSISIAMAFSIDTLKADHLLVKKLAAIESQGQVTEICTGKTATLTKNDMSVNAFYTGTEFIQNRELNTLTSCNLNDNLLRTLKDAIIYNCDARIEMSDDAMYVPQGNGTEIGMVKFLSDNEISVQDLFTHKQRYSIVETNIPFGPIRKRQVVAVRTSKDTDYVRVIVKGAPENIVPMCSSQLNRSGEVEQIDDQERDRILADEIIQKMAKKGFRTLAYAYRDYSTDEWESVKEENNNFQNETDRQVLEQDLVFLAAFALNDDLREGVQEVVAKLFKGGVNVRMISGDNIETATEVAKKAGILQGDDDKYEKVCMLGRDFREAVGGVRKVMDAAGNEKFEVVNKPNFRAIAQRLKVLARAIPEDKFALIVGLKELGASVAVTADGINDAPALKNANVGFCMGISGCQVAKESSDIVILDDNFKSVFRATQWGRNIYDNVRKFIVFQMTVNISALVIVFLSGATLGDSPFNVIQLLWCNMVMDTLAAIALATEPPHPTELKQGRIKKHDKVFLPEMWRAIFGQVIYQVIVMIILLYAGPTMFGIKYDLIDTPFYITSNNPQLDGLPTNKLVHYTLLFNTFMMMNLFNELNARKIGVKEFNIFERFFNNFLFLAIIAGQFVAQWFMVELGGSIFRTTPLPFSMVLASFLLGAGSLVVAAILKATPVEWLEKIKIELNEEGVEEGSDIISRVHEKISGSLKRSETERLLDSQ